MDELLNRDVVTMVTEGGLDDDLRNQLPGWYAHNGMEERKVQAMNSGMLPYHCQGKKKCQKTSNYFFYSISKFAQFPVVEDVCMYFWKSSVKL